MKARVKWVEQVSFLGETESSHAILMDGSPAAGGRNLGPRPMEMLLLGAGGCTSFDVISILKKKRMDVVDFEVKVHTEKAQDYPQIWTVAELEYIVTGRNIDPKAVERAMELSKQTYCPAQNMLGKAVDIKTKYTIVEID